VCSSCQPGRSRAATGGLPPDRVTAAAGGKGTDVTEVFPRLRRVLRDDLDTSERAVLASWLSFTTTFAAVRGITYSIRAGKGPFRNIGAGGEHLHHYLWGICLLAGVGAVAVHGEERHRSHPAVATAYGSGLALIVDEFALLLDLRDVYWAKQGRLSVDVGIGGIAATGSYFALLPVARALRRRRLNEYGRRGSEAHPDGHREARSEPSPRGGWRTVWPCWTTNVGGLAGDSRDVRRERPRRKDR
jgi:hypothetical protein